MATRKWLAVIACIGVFSGCGVDQPGRGNVDIAKVLDVESTFGPPFNVLTAGPSGIDPKLLGPRELPEGASFDPPECAKYAAGQMLPEDLRGNMAAVSAEGEGNRFIAIALETSEPVPFDPAMVDTCHHATFTVGNATGVVDVIDAPQVDGVETLATHRVVETTVGEASSAGEMYTYAAYLGDYLVLVTANQLVVADQPVAAIDVARAERLFTDAVAAVRS